MCVCVYLNYSAVQQKLTQLCKSTIVQLKKKQTDDWKQFRKRPMLLPWGSKEGGYEVKQVFCIITSLLLNF